MDILQGARGLFSDFRDDHEDLFNALTDDGIDPEEKTKIFMHAMGESKKTSKHPLRKLYERIGGK
jgi:hypothetical protein